MLFILRDACSDRIAQRFRAFFMGYRTMIARYVAKFSIPQMRLCETKYQGGGSAECQPLFKRIALYGVLQR